MSEDIFEIDLSFSESEDEDADFDETNADVESPTEGLRVQIGEQEAYTEKAVAVESRVTAQAPSNINIDKDGFNTHYFVKRLVNDKPIHEILEYSNGLTQEIKALDSDMQMLVYENYNKFISATDTIREMKTKV